MTSRERLVAACRGGDVDRKAVILWPSHVGDQSDARIVPVSEVAMSLANEPDKAVLALISSPLGRAVDQGLDLNEALHRDPARGNEMLDGLVSEVRAEMTEALARGADGIFYRLQGAHPGVSTPMQYGGFYLERDRELLEEVAEARLNVLFVEGGPEPYLDFVSDLPAHLMAWDDQNVDLQSVRAMRPGAIAATHEDAEVLFAEHLSQVEPWIRPTGEWAPTANHG